MRIAFNDETLFLEDAPETAPYAEWDDPVDEYRTCAYRYRALRAWVGKPTDKAVATVETVNDAARSYSELHLTPQYPSIHTTISTDVWQCLQLDCPHLGRYSAGEADSQHEQIAEIIFSNIVCFVSQ